MRRTNATVQNNSLIPVAIADCTRMGCQLLAEALSRDNQIKVVFSGWEAEPILAALPEKAPAVVLLSSNLGGVSSSVTQLVREMHNVLPSVQVVILRDELQRELVIESFRAGACGVVARNESVESLCKCIHVVASGQIWANTEAIHFLLEHLCESGPVRLVDAKQMPLLSKREGEVVRWVAEGYTNREIAAQMCISEHTVKNYLFRVFDKLGVSSRIEVILYAFSQFNHPPRVNLAHLASEPQSDHDLFLALLRAAEHSCEAQVLLSQMFMEGRGVGHNRIAALTWVIIAEKISAEVERASRLRQEELKMKMSVQEVAEAQSEAEKWLEVHRPTHGLQARPSIEARTARAGSAA